MAQERRARTASILGHGPPRAWMVGREEDEPIMRRAGQLAIFSMLASSKQTKRIRTVNERSIAPERGQEVSDRWRVRLTDACAMWMRNRNNCPQKKAKRS